MCVVVFAIAIFWMQYDFASAFLPISINFETIDNHEYQVFDMMDTVFRQSQPTTKWRIMHQISWP